MTSAPPDAEFGEEYAAATSGGDATRVETRKAETGVPYVHFIARPYFRETCLYDCNTTNGKEKPSVAPFLSPLDGTFHNTSVLNFSRSTGQISRYDNLMTIP